MKMHFLGLCALLGTISESVSSSATETPESDGLPRETIRAYDLQFTEFRLIKSSEKPLTESDFQKSFEQLSKDGEIEIIGTARLRAFEGLDSWMHVGRTEMVGEKTKNFGGPQNQIRAKQQPIGTIARATPKTVGDHLQLQLTFESSRYEQGDTGVLLKELTTLTVDTTFLIDPARTKILVGKTTGKPFYLAVAIKTRTK